MKKSYLTAVLLCLLALTVNAQKLLPPKIDKMTGDTTLKTSEERIFTSLSWTGGETDILYTYAAKYKGSKFLVFHINVTNGKRSSVFAVSKGSKAFLKIANGSIIELTAGTSEISESQVFSGTFGANTRGDAYPIFELTKELEEKFKGVSVVMVRIETTNGNMDFEIKEKKATIISKEIELI
ncbi:MAG: hypothetical protein V4456_11550 [Bacteroidota bacterium]